MGFHILQNQRVQRAPAVLQHTHPFRQTHTYTYIHTSWPHFHLSLLHEAFFFFEKCKNAGGMLRVYYLVPVLSIHLSRCHVLEQERERLVAGVTCCQVQRCHFLKILQQPISMPRKEQFHETNIALQTDANTQPYSCWHAKLQYVSNT